MNPRIQTANNKYRWRVTINSCNRVDDGTDAKLLQQNFRIFPQIIEQLLS